MALTISGSTGLIFPNGGTSNPSGTVVGTTDVQTLSSKTLNGATINTPTINTPVISGMSSSIITSGTAVDCTGTSINFTSIPSWAKRITVMLNGVSTNGSSNLIIQIGTSSGIVSTGYYGTAALVGASTASSTMSSGFLLTPSQGSATITSGIITLCLQKPSTNTWVSSGSIGSLDAGNIALSAGVAALSGILDRIRITTVNGTDAFDGGVINIMYE